MGMCASSPPSPPSQTQIRIHLSYPHYPCALQQKEEIFRYCRISPPISATKTQFRQFFREISNYSPKLAKFHHNLPHFSEFSFLFNTFLDSIRYPLHLQTFNIYSNSCNN